MELAAPFYNEIHVVLELYTFLVNRNPNLY